jgi:hypothetical protein
MHTVATAACYAMVSITIVNFIITLVPWPYFAHLETFIQIYVFLEILQSVAKGHTKGLLVQDRTVPAKIFPPKFPAKMFPPKFPAKIFL